MKTIAFVAIVVALATFAMPCHARGHANAWFGKVPHTTKATRAASTGLHIASLVAGASHTASAHITHTHSHKSK